MECPLCKKPLDKSIFYGIELDYCSSCLGFWFEEDELRLAKDAKDKELKWLDIDLWKKEKEFQISPSFVETSEGKRGQKLCPVCRMPLYEVNYGDSEIRVDLCNLCYGIWLDRGEFKKIIEYLKKKVDTEVLENYIKNLIEEAWEIFTGPETLREEVFDFLTILKLLNYKFLTQHPTLTKIISSLPK